MPQRVRKAQRPDESDEEFDRRDEEFRAAVEEDGKKLIAARERHERYMKSGFQTR